MRSNAYLLLIASLYASSVFASNHFLTFIMPCYNCADTVIESLDSIFNQQLNIPFEVICTDDKSTDTTPTLLLAYKETHPAMSVYFHDKNQGGGAARNTCIKYSHGDIIFCLDSDNVLAPNSIMPLIKHLDDSGCEAAAFQELRFFEGDAQNPSKTWSWFFQAPNNICDLNHIITMGATPGASGNYLYTRDSYNRAGGYPEGHPADTWGFGLKQHATGTKIALLPNSYYLHRFCVNGYWSRESRAGRMLPSFLHVVKEFPEIFTPNTWLYLSSRDNKTYSLVKDIDAQILQLIPQKALDYLFQAYRYEQLKEYVNALQAYKNAIDAGCWHKKIHNKISTLQEKLSH